MSSKSLSTSTLSLRFMQNAHRAKQLKEVELDRAEVKDDEKWEVSQAVRESWGISQEPQSRLSEVHESSYLPFLFSETDDVRSDPGDNAAVKKTTGRRIFNKKGEMVAVGSSDTGTTFPSAPEEPASQASSSSRKVHPRPVSISASGSSGHLRGFDQLTKPKDGKVSKSAREAIFESGGVGTDLKTETRKNPGLTATTTFLKPVGVDDPKQSQRASTTPASIKSEDVIDGARQKKKSKRDREVGDATEDGKRLKKNRINPE